MAMDDDPYGSFKDDNSNLTIVLRTLADELMAADAEVKRITEELEVATNLRRDIAETRIPAATDGLDGKFELGDGRTLTIKEEIRASIAGDKKVPAIQWMDAHGFGHIVKRQMTFEFAKDDQARAEMFKKVIGPIMQEMQLVMKENHQVHPATLVAWVKERLGEGDDLPVDIFGIFRQRTAKVKD